MPKGTNQKLKLYYLAKIMVEKTDDSHYLTMPEIQKLLSEYEVTADRKSLYDDMEALRVLGIDVIGEQQGRKYYYYVGGKHFELAELKLLVDAIQSSKFITERKSSELIKKLTALVSEYEATQLKRQVVVQGRVKTMNESIYYLVDEIQTAMLSNKRITFEYLTWNLKKEMVPRKEGLYEESPWALTWDDENYYLISYDHPQQKIKFFRVDKMRKITITDKRREGREEFEQYDMAAWARMNFGMFGGKETMVKIAFSNHFAGIMIDRFGKDMPIRPSKKEGWSETTVEVAISDQFFGWIFSLATNVEILEPADVRERYKQELANLVNLYK